VGDIYGAFSEYTNFIRILKTNAQILALQLGEEEAEAICFFDPMNKQKISTYLYSLKLGTQ
jgi:hypothetical protein